MVFYVIFGTAGEGRYFPLSLEWERGKGEQNGIPDVVALLQVRLTEHRLQLPNLFLGFLSTGFGLLTG